VSVRVGHIEFLNCYPLYYGLQQRAIQGLGSAVPFELVPGVPTDLNRMLLAGTIDFGPISSIAYARDYRQLALSRRLSISSNGAVDSIQLVSRRPLERIESVALTPKSATSVALLKTIMKLRYGKDVTYDELRGDPAAALEQRDAVLLIGDDGLEAMWFPLEGTLRYDLGDLWQEWTGLPMVYAVWASRTEFLERHSPALAGVEAELVASMDFSRRHAAEVVEGARRRSRFDAASLDRYFGVLRYGFAPEYQAGLRRFYELAHEAGEIAEVPPLSFLDGTAEEVGTPTAPPGDSAGAGGAPAASPRGPAEAGGET
jgi:chorismate dehydratase